MRLGWLAQTALLAAQAARSGGFPWATWAGSLNLFVWLVVGAYLIWGCRARYALLGLAIMPLAAGLLLASWLAGAGSSGDPVAYSTPFLVFHVGLVLAGFAGFTLAAALAGLYLWQERRLKQRSAGLLRLGPPSLVTLDGSRRGRSLVALPALTLGIAPGLVRLGPRRRLRRADGGTLATWASTALVLVLRYEARLARPPAAYLALAGFALVAFVGSRCPRGTSHEARARRHLAPAARRSSCASASRSISSPPGRSPTACRPLVRRTRPLFSRPATAPSSTSRATTTPRPRGARDAGDRCSSASPSSRTRSTGCATRPRRCTSSASPPGSTRSLPGEGEILGQVRAAYEAGATGPLLDRLFRQALHAGRKVRAQTAIGESPASVSSAAAALAAAGLRRPRGPPLILLVGAGKIGELAARKPRLARRAIAVVANRTRRTRRELAERFGGAPLPLERLEEELERADVVVSSTSARGFVLARERTSSDAARAAGARSS